MRTVLAVDDSPIALHVIRVLLASSAQYAVLECSHGLAALDVLARVPVDLIILDLNMPVMNGFEVLQQLQKRPAYSSIPVIVISTEGAGEDIRRALTMGARAYLTKPFQPSELMRLIDALAVPGPPS